MKETKKPKPASILYKKVQLILSYALDISNLIRILPPLTLESISWTISCAKRTFSKIDLPFTKPIWLGKITLSKIVLSLLARILETKLLKKSAQAYRPKVHPSLRIVTLRNKSNKSARKELGHQISQNFDFFSWKFFFLKVIFELK